MWFTGNGQLEIERHQVRVAGPGFAKRYTSAHTEVGGCGCAVAAVEQR